MENTKQVTLFDGKTMELVDVRQFHKDATAQQIGDCFTRLIPYSYYAPLTGETREFFFELANDCSESRSYLYIKGLDVPNNE